MEEQQQNTMTNNVKRKQTTIVETLNNKRSKQKEQEIDREEQIEDYLDAIEIIAYLRQFSDITSEEHYVVSTMAKVYFREHSNINEVLDNYIELNQIPPMESKERYLPNIIRRVISYGKTRLQYPFNMFRFNSLYHESIGKLLLQYPTIVTLEDLNDVKEYFMQYSIQQCQVDLNINNKLREFEQEYLKKKIQKSGYRELRKYLKNATNYGLRQYYEEKNLVENFYLDDMTLEELLMISTFEEAVKNHNRINDVVESEHEESYGLMFMGLKEKRSLIFELNSFIVHPKYNLISNNLTKEQQYKVTIKKDNFYKYTNAKYLLQFYKYKIPVDETKSIVEKRIERRRLFHLKYVRSKHKNLPPFHNLHWIEPDTTVQTEETPQISETQPGTSNTNVWKPRAVQERNDFHETPAIQSPIEQCTNLERSTIKRKLTEYLCTNKIPQNYVSILDLLSGQGKLLIEIEKTLRQEYHDEDFEVKWALSVDKIIENYIFYHLRDRDANFLDLLQQCCESIREQLNEKLNDIGLELPRAIGEPLASSTQGFEPVQHEEAVENVEGQYEVQLRRPFQDLTNPSDDIFVANSNNNNNNNVIKQSITIVPSLQIKQEKLSENPYLPDSDCQFVTPSGTEIISISDDEDSNLKAQNSERDSLQKQRMDKYQQNLNYESQGDDFEEYRLLSRDSSYSGVTLRSRNNRQERISNGKISLTGCDEQQESNNFSIFLSSQLMLDYARHIKITTSMTFSKEISNSSESFSFGRMCFMMEIQRVVFRKNHLFEIYINLPQFSLYNVCVQNGNIKEALNLNEQKWHTLIINLNQLEYYDFVRNQNRKRKEKEFEYTIKNHLDLYFTSLSSFKKFQFNAVSDSNVIECESAGLNLSYAKNVTNSIKPNILSKIKSFSFQR